MSNHIRKFESFKVIKHKFDKYNEAVIQIDDKYKVGGIEVAQSLINSYVKKVKDETGRNIRQMFSDMEIAEQLVKYVAVNKLDVDKIPAAALLGGDIPMDNDDIIDEPTAEVATEDGLTDPAQPVENTENVEGGEPNLEEPVQEEPTQDEDTLPTGDEEHEFEEPNLDETENPEGYEEPEHQEENEGDENQEESESDEDKDENEEENQEEEGNDNTDLPI